MRRPQGFRSSALGKFKCCCGPGCKPTCDGYVTSGMAYDEANCDCCDLLTKPDSRGFAGQVRRR